MKTIAFFNNKGGVGKTTLVYHLAWMLREMEIDVVALELDPQANLTAAFLGEERQSELWLSSDEGPTVFAALRPLFDHLGDLSAAPLERVGSHLSLVPGDLALSRFEDRLADAWPQCLSGTADAFRVTTAFYRMAAQAAAAAGAAVVLIDVGPSLGALNRAALVASDHVVVPLSADLFSLQGLRNLGPTLSRWRSDWTKRRAENGDPALLLPRGEMKPAGYVILQHAVRADRPVKAYQRWADRIPASYHHEILGEAEGVPIPAPDPERLAVLRHYRSLMPLAHDARKPMFLLKAADGAIGSHAEAVSDCYRDFQALATKIIAACDLA